MRIPYDRLASDGLKALGGVYAYVSKCGLEKSLVDLIYLRASLINGCAYCVDAHSHDLLQAGVPMQKVLVLQAWREARHLFTEREQAALSLTDAITRIAEAGVPDAIFESARAKFSEEELANLTIAVGLINANNRIAITFHREPDFRPVANAA